jgi:glutathione S-transferase
VSLILYDNELDPESYAARLLLSFLGLPYRRILVDTFPGRQQPPGHDAVPVLVDGVEGVEGARSLQGAVGVLEGLAARHEPSWSPAAEDEGRRWLAFAAATLATTGEARARALFTADGPSADLIAEAALCLELMDDHLTELELGGMRWFVADRRSIIDVLLFAPACLSTDYGLEHDSYPALRRWIRRVRALPGFLTMPGIPQYY